MDPIKKGYADTAAGQIHFRRVEGAGAPVVLLHRTPVDSASFEPMLRLMAGRRAAIALDTPGFGQSFHPPGSPTTANYAAWFLAALAALDIPRFHLGAHHTGTHFAAEVARRAPDRALSLLLSGVLYASADERAAFRREIGNAAPIDSNGAYLRVAWTTMKGLYPVFDPDLVHAETLGALASPTGRDQAFDAILSQDFAAVLDEIRCPIRIVQASDDPLDPFLDRVREHRPDIPIQMIGPAGMAAPERQAPAYATAALAFAEAQDPDPFHAQATRAEFRPMSDRLFQLFRAGDRFDLKRTIAEPPQPGSGEVLVRVRAVSINRRDIMILRGQGYPVGDANGFTPLSDAAGEIVAVGPDVAGVTIGDRVCSTFFQGWPGGRIGLGALSSALGAGGRGVFADHVLLSAGGVTPLPPAWSFEQGACLPCAGVTAWSALMTLGGLQPDDWVFVLGTGGVAIFGLQIAAAAGAKVMVASSSDAKLERARTLGAAATVNYSQNADWDAQVREITGGVHHVLELGGAGTLQRSLASLAPGGHVALIGALDGFGGEMSAAGLIIGVQRVSAVACGSRADQIALTDFMVEHGLKPQIDSVFEVDAAEAAFDRAAGGAFGKVVIRLG